MMSLLQELDMSLLERAGGWAAVLLIVRWMMSRIDRLIESSDKQTKAMIDEFKEWRVQEAMQHKNLEDGQMKILAYLNRMSNTP